MSKFRRNFSKSRSGKFIKFVTKTGFSFTVFIDTKFNSNFSLHKHSHNSYTDFFFFVKMSLVYFKSLFFVLLLNWVPISLQFVSESNKQRNPLAKSYEIPFVPEEFKLAPKRIIFDKDDFVSLLPSPDLAGPLRDAISQVLVETQARANFTTVRCSFPIIRGFENRQCLRH